MNLIRYGCTSSTAWGTPWVCGCTTSSERCARSEPGMVYAVEPGIYVRKDDVLNNPTYKKLTPEEQKSIAAALDRYANLGVRIEDDILVTKSGYELLSSGTPRSVEAIEAHMAGE